MPQAKRAMTGTRTLHPRPILKQVTRSFNAGTWMHRFTSASLRISHLYAPSSSPVGPDLTVNRDDGSGLGVKAKPGQTAFFSKVQLYELLSEEEKSWRSIVGLSMHRFRICGLRIARGAVMGWACDAGGGAHDG
jgi:hypothetical protein